MKILGSIWFTNLPGQTIGIVLGKPDVGEEKAYIGVVRGEDQKKEEDLIAKHGAPFPVKQAKEMIT